VKKQPDYTRRSFLKNGALLAAPLAAVAAPAAIIADDNLKTRLARLEDEAAIRELHQSWLRQINGAAVNAEAIDAPRPLLANSKGAAFDQLVRRIALDHTGEPDAIDLAADGKSATGRSHCAVEIETALPQDCTLAQMAHAQGSGFLCRTERRIVRIAYAKSSPQWAIKKVEFIEI
jgi:hypothetical protein